MCKAAHRDQLRDYSAIRASLRAQDEADARDPDRQRDHEKWLRDNEPDPNFDWMGRRVSRGSHN